ncbi:hypothetical protein [Methylomonas methanica]|uniref:hypothetical protein n=1 Tax=Methylomonas methanica TaxID=421 RepID=UPI00059B67CD|nr:hypothetical protein [Methylomonas methanica]
MFANLVWIMLGQVTVAAELKVAGNVDQGVEYDDNISLRSEPASAFGYLLRPSFRLDWKTASMAAGISAGGDIRRYDDERWNCDNVTLGLNLRYVRKRNAFSVTGSYGQSCSYSQQVSDTGILLPSNQSDSKTLSPNWSWQMTRRDSLSLSPNYSQTAFTSTVAGPNGVSGINLRDNQSFGVNLSEEHQWNRHLASTSSMFFSHSIFSGSNSVSSAGTSSQNVFGFQVGGQYVLSHNWTINANGGGRWVQSPGSGSGLNFGETFNVAVDYKGRRDNFSLNLSRSVSPSAFGQIQDVKSLAMRYEYELNRKLSFGVNGRYSESQAVGQSITQLGQKRNYYDASAELAWKFAREWRLSASYRYRMQEYASTGAGQTNSLLAGARDSNAIMFHLNYNWDGWRTSR